MTHKSSYFLAVLLLVPSAVQARPEICCSRSFWVAPTYQFLFGDAFESRSGHGLGLAASYEFHISPRFNLGLGLAYRLYPDDPLLHQVGYGALFKHFFSRRWATSDGVFPFVDYGLLLQQSFLAGQSGNAVSHDTRLGGGLVVRLSGVPFYVGAAGHLSSVAAFDRASQWAPYVDFELGWLHAFGALHGP